tara:strand:- start:1722 stop:3059 length:1338 start_codon:yes stop_codon:yes gene_type:complete
MTDSEEETKILLRKLHHNKYIDDFFTYLDKRKEFVKWIHEDSELDTDPHKNLTVDGDFDNDIIDYDDIELLEEILYEFVSDDPDELNDIIRKYLNETNKDVGDETVEQMLIELWELGYINDFITHVNKRKEVLERFHESEDVDEQNMPNDVDFDDDIFDDIEEMEEMFYETDIADNEDELIDILIKYIKIRELQDDDDEEDESEKQVRKLVFKLLENDMLYEFLDAEDLRELFETYVEDEERDEDDIELVLDFFYNDFTAIEILTIIQDFFDDDIEDPDESDDDEILDVAIIGKGGKSRDRIIKERGNSFKVKIGKIKPSIKSTARKLPNIDMKFLRDSLNEKNPIDYYKKYKSRSLELHPDRPNGDTIKFQELLNAHSIVSNFFKVKNLIESAKKINKPINKSGRTNLELDVDESGYTIEENLHLVTDKETREILKKINKTKFM